jgi:F0F1-type ATP synthase assembly protein I
VAPKEKSYAALMGIGMGIATELCVSGWVGAMIGEWADKRWGTGPWLTTLGLALFLGLAIFHATKLVSKIMDDDQ